MIVQIGVCCVAGLVAIFALRRLGLSIWRSWAIYSGLLVAGAAVIQFSGWFRT